MGKKRLVLLVGEGGGKYHFRTLFYQVCACFVKNFLNIIIYPKCMKLFNLINHNYRFIISYKLLNMPTHLPPPLQYLSVS